MPPSKGWYCVCCNTLFSLEPKERMCPACTHEPVFDLATAEGLAAARELEREEALDRLKQRHTWANLLAIPATFGLAVGAGLIIIVTVGLAFVLMALLLGRAPEAGFGMVGGSVAQLGVLAFATAFPLVVYWLRRRANQQFRKNEEERARATPGGALEAKVRGGDVLEKDDPMFALAPDADMGIRDDEFFKFRD